MTQVTYPGVYIQEVPSGVRTIAPVSTSVCAFVDFFREGPMNEAVEIDGKAGFDRVFGGLHRDSEASYAIDQFFTNGGTKAYVVRVASGAPAAARVTIRSQARAGVVADRSAQRAGRERGRVGQQPARTRLAQRRRHASTSA